MGEFAGSINQFENANCPELGALSRVARAFVTLIHDVDHAGVRNLQPAKEKTPRYRHQSVTVR